MSKKEHWVFGYGSLIWRPDFNYLQREVGTVVGWERRFWQGSHDHRGTPESPGRVVTLVANPSACCTGVAYLIDQQVLQSVFEQLDHREKNGYKRIDVDIALNNKTMVSAVTYLATEGNEAYLGPASDNVIAQQIAQAVGPSGPNSEYLLQLAVALRHIDAHDDHVFNIESALLQLQQESG